VWTDACTPYRPERLTVVIASGSNRESRIPASSTGIVPGTGALASFFRGEPLVSGGNARVYLANNRFVRVKDFNSTNGTFVNGEAVHSMTCLAGKDVLCVGCTDIWLDWSCSPASDPGVAVHSLPPSDARDGFPGHG
jgi:pSer/pThr/pTyr-binding forkhead associated (FHA) protein